jgi:hypothetical protein
MLVDEDLGNVYLPNPDVSSFPQLGLIGVGHLAEAGRIGPVEAAELSGAALDVRRAEMEQEVHARHQSQPGSCA